MVSSPVLALEHRITRIQPRRIHLRRGGTLLVRGGLQPDDRVFRPAGDLVQEEDSRGAYVVGGGEGSIW